MNRLAYAGQFLSGRERRGANSSRSIVAAVRRSGREPRERLARLRAFGFARATLFEGTP